MTATNLPAAWARLFLRSLASAGVRELVISPGSRSTPLVLAAASEPALLCHDVVDERTAAFFALGQARVTGRPTALLCTSGTAGVHYGPAVVEAAMSFVPLVIITADRPWEAQDAASPQTIDQVKLFGGACRHYAELGLPDPSPDALAAVVRVAAQAVLRALHPTPGPTHVNARFRKPLEPVEVDGPEAFEPAIERLIARGSPRVYPPHMAASAEAIDQIVALAAGAEHGLVVCGPAPRGQRAARPAVAELGRVTGFPILAEATSQLRFAPAPGAARCDRFDLALRSGGFRRGSAPDLILEFGAPPVSSGYAALLAEHGDCPRVVVAEHGWNDPSGGASALVFAAAGEVAGRVSRELEARPAPGSRRAWAERWTLADAELGRRIDEAEALPALTEGSIARALLDALPEGAILVLGNSTPVRDVDTYAAGGGRSIDVLHQRGASGIDGLVSGAAGAASAAGGAPVALLLGDLSLLHDLGGLNLARAARSPLVILAVQNDGGRIFEQLPIASSGADRAAFERHFITPQGLSFEPAAALFGLAYARPLTRAALRASLAAALAHRGATLIEAVVAPGGSSAARAELLSRSAAALARSS